MVGLWFIMPVRLFVFGSMLRALIVWFFLLLRLFRFAGFLRTVICVRSVMLPKSNRSLDHAWDAVRTWPSLRGEAKLAWLFLFQSASRRFTTFTTTAAAVGAHQGTSDRSGQRALSALESAGLVEVLDRCGGRWTLCLVDPAIAMVARRRAADPQSDLFAADVAPDPPADVSAEPLPFRSFGTHASEAKEPEARERSTDQSIGASGGTAGQKRPEENRSNRDKPVVSVKTVLEKWASQMTQPRECGADTIDQLVAWQLRAVGDPALRVSPCLRVARAIFERRVKKRVIVDLIDRVKRLEREGRLVNGAWVYYVGSARRILVQHGVDWPSSPRAS